MYIQLNTNGSRGIYKTRNTTKGLVKQVYDETWSQCIESIEHDVYGRQLLAYKNPKRHK